MKKSTIKSFAFICTLWISISGCESFLDVTPKGLDVLKTTDQFNGIFNNANLFSYLNVRNQPGGISSLLGSAEMPLFMGDDVFSSAGFLNAIPTVAWQNGFKWEANPYLPTDESNEWGAFYNQLYNYNLVAAGVMSSEGGTEARKKELLAEAKACRAFNHFIVANLFGQPYNVNTATTDLSVPIVVNADVNASDFKRATVKELYDFVINELTQAIPDLQPKVYSRVRMSRPAAQYMLGMVYFQMGNYASALTYLNEAKAGLTGGPLPVRLYNYNTTMTAAAPTGWFNATQPWRGASGYPLLYNSDENIFLRQLSTNSTVNRNCLFLKPAILALFTTTDHRRKMFLDKNADLEELRKNRMPAADATVTVTNQDDLVKFILTERHREFASTGMRWFDMRRLYKDAKFNNLDRTKKFDAETFTLTDERLTLKIPPQILQYNPNMVDNP